MVVLASDTITPPLLPRNIDMGLPRGALLAARKVEFVTSTDTTTVKHHVATNWPTRTKIIFASCVAAAVVLVFALILFLQCRRRRRARMLSPRDGHRSSSMAIAANQQGGFQPVLVRQLTDRMGGQAGREKGEGGDGRFSEQPGGGMYYHIDNHNNSHHHLNGGPYGGTGHQHHHGGHHHGGSGAGDEKFETVPLGGGGAGVAPARPGGIYRFGERQSRFSP